jgi:hypothetical protein
MFESVDEDRAADATGGLSSSSSSGSGVKAGVEGQIKALETTLEELRRRRGASS